MAPMFKLKDELRLGNGKLRLNDMFNRFQVKFREFQDIGKVQDHTSGAGHIWSMAKEILGGGEANDSYENQALFVNTLICINQTI